MLLDWYSSHLHPWHRDRLARWNVRVVTPPTTEPVSLEQARLWCRVDAYPADGSPTLDVHPDDDLIRGLISAAREWVEMETGRALAPQVLEVSHSQFPMYGSRQMISLPMAPIRAIESVSYRGSDGVDVFLAIDEYLVDYYGYVPHVLPAIDTAWPDITAYPNAVRVRYEAGYAVTSESPDVAPFIPQSLITAMQLLIGYWYGQRESVSAQQLAEVPLGPRVLVKPYSLHLGVA